MSELLQLAISEYKRLCNLNGEIPYGECQIVALMMYLKAGGEIIRGYVYTNDRAIDHFWLEINQEVCDPLMEDILKNQINNREKIEIYDPLKIIKQFKDYIKEFPTPCYPLPTLRYKIAEEILSL